MDSYHLGKILNWINKFKKKFTRTKKSDIIDSLIYENMHKRRAQRILCHFAPLHTRQCVTS